MHSYSVIAHDNDIYITGGHSSNQCTVDIVSGLILNFSFSNFFSIFLILSISIKSVTFLLDLFHNRIMKNRARTLDKIDIFIHTKSERFGYKLDPSSAI